ncbi:MAG: hypothetical protein A3I29_03965 [Candidatus Magasanikbacteria bacterium RIFCSPLOWO2_02_FULL_44_11]|uniref:dTDP-4-dehydrorhamnose reductase n=2 Tax=Candidatus Magasanikiibacteriota TaxID=1752731 RepID=A0A1F6NA28_9BACT|nr:MAG: hypothetical protein A3D53_02085 [Candidatus Magasanikbacteria bacterium RIFCSPHIGHO2_02_FULL_45_10]OGH80573.1 MAG: hypothetical protein A3I29_03965 [Candidatus Magasanikbacteria bacterium RIFCSPLOWO2_02_FULL_44_11]
MLQVSGVKQPNIAIVGLRGIPNSYGGFETLAEEIADRLVKFGVRATVYCRRSYFQERPAIYKGVHLIYLPTIENKFLDTPWHTLLSVVHCLIKRTADTVMVVNIGNAPFALLAKIFGKKIIFCVDGLDWKRQKWNAFARWYLKTCSYFAKYVADEVVTDAQSVHDYYKKERATTSTHIPYGTDIEMDSQTDGNILAEHGLISKKYFIYVARFEPENNPLFVIKAYVNSGSMLPLVMVGDNRYDLDFVKTVKAAANDRVIFLGYIFGQPYKQLVKNALASIRAAEVGGLSPAVIEAMGRGVCVVANDKPENREPLAETGLFYPLEISALARHFKQLSLHPEQAIELGQKAAQRAMILYSWDKIAFDYFKLLKRVQSPVTTRVDHLQSVTDGAKRILITGAGGMFGGALYEATRERYTVRATSFHPTEPWMTALDVRDRVAYEKIVEEFKPHFIIHAPAITDLEKCERNIPEAYGVNTLPVKYAAELATKYNAQLIYLSTSNVFDGSKNNYTETDEPRPINAYGLTKHMGELMAEYYARKYLIIRLGWFMGGGPTKDKKFVAKIVEQIVAGKKDLYAVTDKAGSISYAPDIAKNIISLLEAGTGGIYNMVSTGMPTRYEVAEEVVSILGYKKAITVHGVDEKFFSKTFTTVRSAHECLVNERLDREGLNRQRRWQESLRDYLASDFAYAKNPASPILTTKPAIAAS